MKKPIDLAAAIIWAEQQTQQNKDYGETPYQFPCTFDGSYYMISNRVGDQYAYFYRSGDGKMKWRWRDCAHGTLFGEIWTARDFARDHKIPGQFHVRRVDVEVKVYPTSEEILD